MTFSRARPQGRRVVISGMGAVCASGVGAQKLWEAARDGVGQIRPLKTERPYDGRIKMAAQVPDFDPAEHIEANVLPFCDPFTQFCVVAADEAMAQAGFRRKDVAGPGTAVIIGSGIGGMTTIEDGIYRYYVEGTRPEMLSVPKLIPSAAPATIGMRYSCLGPTFAIGSACSSATQSIGLGMQMIRQGLVDKAIVGGAEACVINATIRAWEGLRVLTPSLCRPFSKGRNGMSLGEGAAVFILETEEIGAGAGPRTLVRTRRLRNHERRQGPGAPRSRRRVEFDRFGAERCGNGAAAGSLRERAWHRNSRERHHRSRSDFARVWRLWARGAGVVDEAHSRSRARRERRPGARHHH